MRVPHGGAANVGLMARTHFVRSLVYTFLVFACFAAVMSLAVRKVTLFTPHGQVVDFRVVACAERVVLQRGDPYRTEPLRSCEHALAPEINEPAWSVTPFALPPYSAALLLPFGLFDFSTGRAIWYVLLVLALCVASAATAEIVNKPAVAVALIIVPTLGTINLFYGETVLLAFAAVALAALALQRGRPLLAAIAAAAALIEPAVGLPAVVGLFTLRADTRRPLLVCGAILAGYGLVVLNFGVNLEYLTAFVPLHGHSEIFARDQYSLTRLAYVLGVSERLAGILGSLSYAAAIAVGVVTGRRLAEQMALPALIVLMPVAVSTLGGPFVHDYEVLAALLAAVVIARDSTVARVAVALLSIVWADRWQSNLLPAIAAAAGIAWMYVPALPRVRRVAYTVAVPLAILVMNVGMPKSPAHHDGVIGAPMPPIADTDLSSIPWEWRIRLNPRATDVDAANELQKVPFWLAVVVLPWAGIKRKKPLEQFNVSNKTTRPGLV